MCRIGAPTPSSRKPGVPFIINILGDNRQFSCCFSHSLFPFSPGILFTNRVVKRSHAQISIARQVSKAQKATRKGPVCPRKEIRLTVLRMRR